jgi:hypothetical protein
MTDGERFDSVWAREVERRFRAEVLRNATGVWTRGAIELLAESHGLKLRWQSDILCFVSHPIGMDGLLALRIGEPVTEDQLTQLETLKALVRLNQPIST